MAKTVDREGLSIEDLGQEYSRRLSQRMIDGTGKTYPFVAIEAEEALKYPRLVLSVAQASERKPFESDLRIDPGSGEIITTRWQKLKTSRDRKTGLRTTQKPEKLTFISPNDMDHDPEDLPESGTPIKLVISRIPDVETAIRQQQHILRGLDLRDRNSEPRQLQEIFGWIDLTARKFKEGPVTEDQLAKWAQEAEDLVAGAGLDRAIDSTKKRLADLLVKAPGEDGLGRINPTVSRVRLRAALLKATERAMVGVFSNTKFSGNLKVLVATRKYTRSVMGDALDSLSDRPNDLRHTDKWVNQVGDVARLELSVPQVAPYLAPSRAAAILLVGCRKSKEDLNRQVLGEQIAEQLYSMAPVTTLIEKRETYAAARQMSWARTFLEQALEDNAEIYPINQP